MSEVFAGIEAALSFGSLIANVTGVSLGILFGAMPGLTAAMGVALLIPLSFGMPPVEAFSMLLGMYAGAIYGGSITAILVGTPGTVAAAATLLEGPKLTAKGQSRKALEMATFASFFGGIFSAVALVTCAPLLATAAMSFGPAEYFALAVFALTVVATLSSGAMCKGLAAAFVGLSFQRWGSIRFPAISATRSMCRNCSTASRWCPRSSGFSRYRRCSCPLRMSSSARAGSSRRASCPIRG